MRFFFRIENSVEVDDHEGQELPGLLEARRIAVQAARELAAEAVKEGAINLGHGIVIEDERHQPLLKVTFGEVITISC